MPTCLHEYKVLAHAELLPPSRKDTQLTSPALAQERLAQMAQSISAFSPSRAKLRRLFIGRGCRGCRGELLQQQRYCRHLQASAGQGQDLLTAAQGKLPGEVHNTTTSTTATPSLPPWPWPWPRPLPHTLAIKDQNETMPWLAAPCTEPQCFPACNSRISMARLDCARGREEGERKASLIQHPTT